jgi:hypothetical protein
VIHMPAVSIVASLGLASTLFTQVVHRSTGILSPSENANCPVTEGHSSFSPPAPYAEAALPGSFWHGHPGLWTMLQVDGTWRGLNQHVDGFRQKVFWWHPGFDGKSEQKPELTVTGRRLDGAGSFVQLPPATNAFDGWAILTGVDVPTLGCWELTGWYRGNTLSFVVSVVP